jgi:hypothetical protein
MAQGNGSGGSDRLDRVEGIIEALANRQQLVEDEFARLLRAQVVTVDVVEKLGHKVDALADAQKITDQKIREMAHSLDSLILIVDEIIRGRKPSP